MIMPPPAQALALAELSDSEFSESLAVLKLGPPGQPK